MFFGTAMTMDEQVVHTLLKLSKVGGGRSVAQGRTMPFFRKALS